jgi:uncharacterized repeat protein (TIGR03803 family)
MRSKQPFSAGKPTFVLFITLLLASAVAPAQTQAQKFKVLHTFHDKDGYGPIGQLVIDSAGNFYGTTGAGGSGNCTPGPGCGTVFKLNKSGKLVWSHSFNGKDGWEPLAGVFRDSAGNLFGTTASGGNFSQACGGVHIGCGVVFKLDASGGETLLHKFSGSPDGNSPGALLVEDAGANLYGTTIYGGAFQSDGGTAFKVNQAGRERILISFGGIAGQGRPGPGLILRGDKNLYGVTYDGGTGGGAGTVFRLSTGGKQTILYNFTGGSDGQGPYSILAADSAGNLYGTTNFGGGANCIAGMCGTVFKLSPQAGGWTHEILYAFCQLSQCVDGQDPLFGPLIIDHTGNIYGTAHIGGNSGCNRLGCGVVFKLDANGQETVLHTFTGGTDGAGPWAGLTMDEAGNLYGTAQNGGDLNCEPRYGGCGVVFEITP